jgi:hypothetical protein
VVKSFWLQIQRTGFNSRRYQIFWEVVGLERGSLSFVSTTEELFERKSSGSDLQIQDYGRRGTAALTTWHHPYPKKFSLTAPSGGHSVCIVRLRTQATEFGFFLFCMEMTITREASGCANTRELTSILWNLNVHYVYTKLLNYSYPESDQCNQYPILCPQNPY